MNVTRRNVSRWALALGGVVVAACGDAPERAATDATRSAKPVTVSWVSDWNAAERGEVAKQAKIDFEQEFPHVTVDQQGWGNATSTYQALAAHLAGGTLADVALVFPAFFHRFAEQGVYLDLTPHLKALRYDKSAVWWHPEPLEHQGKTYGVPFQFIIQTWVYNKNAFEAANVRPPTDAWTTEDLLEANRRLTRPDGTMWGAHMHSSMYTSWPFVYANNSDLVTGTEPVKAQIDQPKTVEVFSYLVDLLHKHRVAPPVQGKNAVQGVSFNNGNLAIAMAGRPKDTAAAVRGRFQMDVMPTPRWHGTRKRSTELGHQGLMVTRFARERGREDAAARFAAWMGGEPGQTLIARLGGATPVVKKIAYGPLHLDGAVPGLKALLDSLEPKADQQARIFKVFKGTQEFHDAVNPVLAQGFGGDLSVPEMIVQAQRAGTAALDEARR